MRNGPAPTGPAALTACAPAMKPALGALLVCPIDHGDLQEIEQTLVCRVCGRVYPVDEGTPDMVVRAID